MSWNKESVKGQQKASTRFNAIEDDDYLDDETSPYTRFRSYDYGDEEEYDEEYCEEEGEEGEEIEKQQKEAKKETAATQQVPVVVKTQQEQEQKKKALQLQLQREQDEKLKREKEEERVQEAKRVLNEDFGVQLPTGASDEVILQMKSRLETRQRVQEQDLQVVAVSCPRAEVDSQEREINLFPSVSSTTTPSASEKTSTSTSSTTRYSSRRRRVVIMLPVEYPEAEAQVFVKGSKKLEYYIGAILRSMVVNNNNRNHHKSNTSSSATAASSSSSSEEQQEEEGMFEAQGSSEPIFLADVCRFAESMLDILARHDIQEEHSSSSSSSSVHSHVSEEAFIATCTKEWARLTGQHFTVKSKTALTVQTTKKSKQEEKEGEDDGEKEDEESFDTRRRKSQAKKNQKKHVVGSSSVVAASSAGGRGSCKTTGTTRSSPKVSSSSSSSATSAASSSSSSTAITAVESRPAITPTERFMTMLTSAFENGFESFSFGTDLFGAPVPDALCRLVNLKYLSLVGTKASNLPAELGQRKIEKLYLRDNRFKQIPKCVFAMKHLRILDMANNKLTAIPQEVGKLTELRVMDFSYNELDSLCSFEYLRKLEALDVTDNNLSGLPPEVGNLPRLWYLHFRGNPMFEIPVDIYYEGIEAVKEHLTKLSTKTLPVPPPTLNEDLAYLMLQIPENVSEGTNLAQTVFSGVLPPGYVPGSSIASQNNNNNNNNQQNESSAAAAAIDYDYSPVLEENSSALVSVRYFPKKNEVVVDNQTGATSIETVTLAEPKLMFRTLRWILAARVPFILDLVKVVEKRKKKKKKKTEGEEENNDQQEEGENEEEEDDEDERKNKFENEILLPDGLHEIEANLFSCFVLAPASPYVLSNFSSSTNQGCLSLVKKFARAGIRTTSSSQKEVLDENSGAMWPMSESLAHFVPVVCQDDLSSALLGLKQKKKQQQKKQEQEEGEEQQQREEEEEKESSPHESKKLKALLEHNRFLIHQFCSSSSSSLFQQQQQEDEDNNNQEQARQDPDIVEFIVGPDQQKFLGHKSLLALRCGFFRTMFLDKMSSTSLSSSSSSVHVLDDVDPTAFAALLTFLYTDQHGKKMNADNVVDLLFLAARYEVPRLRAAAECMVGYHTETANVCQVLQMAHFLQSTALKHACVMFVVSNRFHVEITPEYAELDEDLRNEISAKIKEVKKKK